ncbi:MAG: hypothetical protein ABIF10_05920 [Candidatus Woesearchaeota archaeon]
MPKKGGLKELKDRELSECSPEFAFFVCNGAVTRNLRDCAQLIAGLDDQTFSYHVNKEKNDFASWISDIFGDSVLAKKLAKVKKPKTYADVIAKRIKELEAA